MSTEQEDREQVKDIEGLVDSVDPFSSRQQQYQQPQVAFEDRKQEEEKREEKEDEYPSLFLPQTIEEMIADVKLGKKGRSDIVPSQNMEVEEPLSTTSLSIGDKQVKEAFEAGLLGDEEMNSSFLDPTSAAILLGKNLQRTNRKRRLIRPLAVAGSIKEKRQSDKHGE